MTLPALRDTHYVANDPNERHEDDYRCAKTGCDFRVSVRAFGPGEARRLAHGHILAPWANVAQLVGLLTRQDVELSGDPASPALGSSRTVDPELRPAAPTTYVKWIEVPDSGRLAAMNSLLTPEETDGV